ncbi:MAG: dodecin family protein [Bacillota bacterium]
MTEERLSNLAKVIEVVGVSSNSWEDAAKNAVEKASETLENITGVEVITYNGIVKDGKVTEFKAVVKIAFGLTNR